ncbi:MAG TPA: hypothetical protein ACFYEM_11075, partial [Candidatus Hypogeohydataceae bacterium YC40]
MLEKADKLKMKRDVKGLVKLLQKSSDYRHIIEKDLEELLTVADTLPIKHLIATLENKDNFARKWAVQALGKAGDIAIKPL